MMMSEQTPFPARGWSLGSGQDPTVTVAASASAAGVCRPAAGTPDPGYAGPVWGDPGPGRGLLWFWPQRPAHGACRSGRFRALQAIWPKKGTRFRFQPSQQAGPDTTRGHQRAHSLSSAPCVPTQLSESALSSPLGSDDRTRSDRKEQDSRQ
jgi:hypothetical protein